MNKTHDTMHDVTYNKVHEVTRRKWIAQSRKENALMRLCDDMQREVQALHARYRYWSDEYSFIETCGDSDQNIDRIEVAGSAGSSWFQRTMDKFHALGRQTEKLEATTAARKKLQKQLGLAPTENGYIASYNFGDGVKPPIGFVLLDHELDSTTSVRHYIDENMGGSSLFAD